MRIPVEDKQARGVEWDSTMPDALARKSRSMDRIRQLFWCGIKHEDISDPCWRHVHRASAGNLPASGGRSDRWGGLLRAIKMIFTCRAAFTCPRSLPFECRGFLHVRRDLLCNHAYRLDHGLHALTATTSLAPSNKLFRHL